MAWNFFPWGGGGWCACACVCVGGGAGGSRVPKGILNLRKPVPFTSMPKKINLVCDETDYTYM
jgi:hypothetical protein